MRNKDEAHMTRILHMRIAKIRGLSQFWALRRDLDIVSESSHESLDVLYRGHILHP